MPDETRQRPLHGRRRRGGDRVLHQQLGFEVLTNAAPAFADVKRGNLRLLLAGPTSSAGRPMPDGRTPEPGGWNRIHLIVDDIDGRGRRGCATPARRSATTSSTGPGGQQILLEDPSGNAVELFQPADARAT